MEEGGTSVHKTIREINLVFKGLKRHTVRTDKIGDLSIFTYSLY